MKKYELASFGLTIAALSASAGAQSDPVGAAQLQAVPAPQAAPLAPATPVAPVAPPVVQWNRAAAQDLLSYLDTVDEEGLDAADYEPARLREALASRDQDALNAAATQTFLRLSSDIALGRVRGDARVDWHINDPDLNGNEQYSLMESAVSKGTVRDTLSSLLPTHPQYAELKAVLAETPKAEKAKIEKIRINMDRWRWLPRDLGRKYVIVNVPRYMVAVVEDGQAIDRRRAVAGAVKTATPQLSTTITGVILNPWWEVPKSIEPEVRGKRGYVAVKDADGKIIRWRQPPGPANALGRMKLVMPNHHAIFLHDTNVKGLFDKQARAYSHGCIRTERALEFAEVLLQPTGKWDKAAIQKAIASGKSVQANLAEPIPVYITYFTAAAVADKREIVEFDDIYGRDKPVVTAMRASRAGNTALASN